MISSRPSPKEKIGQELGPQVARIEADRLRDFNLSIGSTGSGVPPTYLTVFRRLELEWVAKLGFQLSQILHAEQEYRFHESLRVGQEMLYRTTLANALEKKGKALTATFLVFETRFCAQEDPSREIAFSKTTLVARESHDA